MPEDQIGQILKSVFSYGRDEEVGPDGYSIKWDFSKITGDKTHLVRRGIRTGDRVLTESEMDLMFADRFDQVTEFPETMAEIRGWLDGAEKSTTPINEDH